MKLMSGSLVLRKGVGTQMLMVSRSFTAAKSVVALSMSAFDQRRERARRDVLNITFAFVELRYFALVNIDADDAEPRRGELHRQRQADVAQPHDTHTRRLVLDLPGYLFEWCHALL